MSEDRFEEFVRGAAQDYNLPPEAPREALWARIAQARAAEREQAARPRHPSWWRWGVGLAAMLALGIGIGRLTIGGGPAGIATESGSQETTSSVGLAGDQPLPATERDALLDQVAEPGGLPGAARDREGGLADVAAGRERATGAVYRVAAVQTLTQAEALLTSFRAEPRRQALDPQVTAFTRDVLTTTRLLLDSPAGRDAELRALLEDLELVLVQIVQLSREATPDELELIGKSMRQRDVLPRLRTAIPAGPAVAGT